jgi:NADPH:quinone reductase-like Zn-dependent oxidoreductase
VAASALSTVTRARAAGTHYSAGAGFPLVPGIDGVGTDEQGRRVAFLMPDAPFGGMGERTLVRTAMTVPVPDALDDVTAAALINPAASAVASLRRRADLQPGETVLVHGATGTTGGIAVQLAKRLGAGRVIAAGRDRAALARLESLGADAVVPLTGDGVQEALAGVVREGVDIVLDYLSGAPTELLLEAVATSGRAPKPLRFVTTGGSAGTAFTVSNAVLASSPVTLIGNGIGSVQVPDLVATIGVALGIAAEDPLDVEIAEVPLAEVETAWVADFGRDRVVFRI